MLVVGVDVCVNVEIDVRVNVVVMIEVSVFFIVFFLVEKKLNVLVIKDVRYLYWSFRLYGWFVLCCCDKI